MKTLLAIAEADVSGLSADLAAKQPLDSDLTTIAGLTPTTDNMIQSAGSAWASRTPAQVKATLALAKGDVGLSNVDNTADAAKTFGGSQIGSGTVAYARLPVGTATSTVAAGDDSRITGAVQKSTATAKGDIFVATASGVITRKAAGTNGQVLTAQSGQADGLLWATLAPSDVGAQPLDADLTTIAGLTATTDNMIQSVGGAWASRTPAQVKAALAIGEGDVAGLTADLAALAAADATKQPLDSDLTTIAGLTPTTDNMIQSVGSAWASRTPAQVKAALAIAEADVTNLTTDLAAKQPLDSDLTTIAGLTATTDNMIQSVGGAWASRTPAQVKTALAIAAADVSGVMALTGVQTAAGTKTFTDGVNVGAATQFRTGTGTPEGVVTAPVGSLYLRTNGGAGTSLYVKESGSGNTGWAAHAGSLGSPNALVINVKDYGAVGDGSTNDTTAITNAIAAANVDHGNDFHGGIVYFPAGVYMTNGGHDIPAYVHIVGCEPAGRYWTYNATDAPPAACALKLRSGTSSTAMFNIGAGSTAFSLRNISLLGNMIGSGIDGISFASSPTFEHNAIVQDVAIIGFTGDGVRGRLFATRWDNLFIGSNLGWGLNCDGTNQWTDSWFSRCIIAGNVLGGVNFESTGHCGEISFTDCRIERSGWDPGAPSTPVATSSPGIRIAGNLAGASFTGVSTDANSGNGVEITRASGAVDMHHIVFTACRFNRDGFGTMSGGSAGNFAEVKITGDAAARVQYISFGNCLTTEGKADDGGGAPSYVHAKYGLWWTNVDYVSWQGGAVSDGHPGGQFNFSSVWRPSINISAPAGIATWPVWDSGTRPTTNLVGGHGWNEATGQAEVWDGSAWVTLGGALDPDLTTIAGLTATTDNMIQSVGSVWASRTPAQVKAALAIVEADVLNLPADLAGKIGLAGAQTVTGAKTFNAGTFLDKGNQVFNVKAYGATGDGSTDDTVAVRAAFTAANALVRAGIAGTIWHPGATVLIPPGVYNLTSIAAVIDVSCNVVSAGATFLAPAAYAGTVLRVGHPTSGNILQGAEISLPDVMKATGTSIVASSIAVTIQNLYSSKLRFGRTGYFETGLNFTGLGEGTVYNEVFLGWVGYCKVAVQLKPGTGGWVNQNTFNGGGIQQSAGYAGGVRQSGWRHLVLDGAGINSVTGNTFVGVSFEGDVSEYTFYVHHAYQNNWYGCRHEAGTAFAAVTVSGGTLTRTAHGLAVGDMIVPTASVAPTGMVVLTPYYVIAVPDADTFTIARKKGGTAITFGSSGTSVVYARPQRIYFDTSGVGVAENVIRNPVNPLYWLDVVHSTGIATGNQQETAAYKVNDFYLPEDLPLFRGRNAYSGATTRAIFAAYAAGVNPVEDPDGWAVALSDRGVVWNAGTIIRTGAGSPESVVTAPIGSLFLRTDGASGTTLYVKSSGTGNTGWVAQGAGFQPLDTDLTTIAGLTATTDNMIQSVGSAWASRTPAQVKAALAIAEADVTNLTTDLAAKQPLDSDLTTIAGLTATTDNMIQSVGGAWASRTPAQVKTALAIQSPDVQQFTASGTWTKPAGAVSVEVLLVGGGAGGGAGRRGGAGTARGGGGGGGAGLCMRRTFKAADLGSTESVTIGAFGAGGTATSTNDTNGANGIGGGITTFGIHLAAPPGIAGSGGTTAGGGGGIAYITATAQPYASGGANGGVTAAGSNAATSTLGAGGGGGGGGISSGDVAFNGGSSSGSYLSGANAGGAAGVVDGTSPGSGTAPTPQGSPGPGGAGGAASITTAAQAGATPNGKGGGGGGGGASLNGNNAGAGGAGAPGVAVIITYF